MPAKSKEYQSISSKKHYLKNRDRMIARSAEYNKFARKRNAEYVYEYLRHHPCSCGVSDIRVLEFHHVRGTKLDNISGLVKCPASIKTIQEEIDKCDVLCANCHRIETKTSYLG